MLEWQFKLEFIYDKPTIVGKHSLIRIDKRTD